MEDNRTLADYNFQKKSFLDLVLRLRGGGGFTELKFCDVENPNALQKLGFSDSAPDWRKCEYGLNILGECKNKKCIAYKKEVICRINCNIFDLYYDSGLVVCPICENHFEQTTCGFTD